MTVTYKINGTALTGRVQFLPRDGTTPALVTSAEKFSLGTCGVVIEDTDAALDIKAWSLFTVEDSEASPVRVFKGFITDKVIDRGGKFFAGAQREWDCDVVDLNVLAHWLTPVTNDGKRPAETDVERVAWALASRVCTDIEAGGGAMPIEDKGLVSTSNPGAYLAFDTREKYLDDFLREMLESSVKNAFLYDDLTDDDVGLFYDRNDATVWASDISISNVLVEVDGDTVFAPFWGDHRANRAGNDVYQSVLYSGANLDAILVESASIETAFGMNRQAVYNNPRVGRAATLLSNAQAYLNVRATEPDVLTIPIRVPSSRINGVLAGQEIDVKLTHIPRYSSGATGRIRRKSYFPAAIDTWDVELEIWFPPTEATDAAQTTCGIVQQTSNQNGDAGDLTLTFPAPPTAGNTLVVVGRKRNSGGSGGLPEFMTVDDLLGRVVNFTVYDTAETLTGDILGPDQAKIMWATAVGDEQVLVTDANKLIFTIYEIAGVDPTDVEILVASSQAASTTKTLGTFADEGSLQIAGYLYGDSGGSPLAQTVGTGWTDDNQHRDLTSDGHPGTIAMHGTSASVVTVSGPAYEWGAVAVAFQGAGCGGEDPLPAPGDEIGSVGAEGTADGSNTDFTTPGSAPFIEGTLRVLHDGIDQTEHITTQDGEAGTYSLDYAPSAGSTLRLYYTSA